MPKKHHRQSSAKPYDAKKKSVPKTKGRKKKKSKGKASRGRKYKSTVKTASRFRAPDNYESETDVSSYNSE